MTASKENDMFKNASHIWSMLDNLANDDPESYRKFINQQLKEGRQAASPPEPHMCVQTTIINRDGNELLYINIMDWPKVPAPKTDEDPIPVIGTSVFDISDKGKDVKVVAVAFNSEILQRYGTESSLIAERDMLITLAINYIEDQNGIKLSRNFSTLPCSVRCKGKSSISCENLMKALGIKGNVNETVAHDGIQCLLQQQMKGNTDDELSQGLSELRLKPNTSNKEGLIEELSSAAASVTEPDYTLTVVDETESVPRHIRMKISLPGVDRVQDCRLEISTGDLYLLVPERYELEVSFPEQIQSVSHNPAKFSKRTSCLMLHLPIDPAGK